MTPAIDASTLNRLCSKDLSIPLGFPGQTADEIAAVLSVPHRIVDANDHAAIVRESNSYVVVLKGVGGAEESKLAQLLSDTRWRKALLVPYPQFMMGAQFRNRIQSVILTDEN